MFRETAIVMATGMIDENNEFTIDDVVGYEVIERDHAALCEGCQRAYDLAGTQGGKQ